MFVCFNDRTKTLHQNGVVAGEHALLILLLDFVVIFRFLFSIVYCPVENLSDPLSGGKGIVR